MTNSKLPKDIEDFYPLSDIQKGMVYHSIVDSNQFIYHTQTVYYSKFKGFDEKIFKKVLELMVEKHSILRTGFNMYDFEEPIQIVHKQIPLDVEHYDISMMDQKEQEEYLKKLLSKDQQKLFNVTNAEVLWRVRTLNLGNDNICFIWISHHAIIDGWSFASLLTEVKNTYLQLVANPNFHPGKLRIDYKYFVVEQIVEKKKMENVEFWKRELDGYKRIEFPGSSLNGHDPSTKKTYAKNLPVEFAGKLKNTARQFDTSLKHLCFGAYVYMLSMLSYENDIVVGLISNSRPARPDGDKIIGCFLNTLPVRVKIPSSLRWMDYIRLIENKLLELKKYERFSFLEIVRIIGDVSKSQNPITDTIFNYTDFHIFDQMSTRNEPMDDPKHDEGGLPEGGLGGTNTLFDFDISSTGGVFNVVFNFSESLIRSEMVSTLCGYFERILDKFIEEPESIANKEELISDEEKQRLLIDFNNTGVEYPRNKTITELFEAQVERIPDNIALIGPSIETKHSESFANAHVSYRELNGKSDRLACGLGQRGVLPESIVGIATERLIEMIPGILGILKSGGAYLPIDPTYPEERIDYMLKDCDAKIMIGRVKKKKNHEIIFMDLLESFNFPASTHPPFLASDSSYVAYIIYTSGSTGRPKGVMVEHRSVIRLVKETNYVEFKTGERILQTSTLSFDASTFEIWGSLLNRMGLVFLPKDRALNHEFLKRDFNRFGISTIWMTAPLFNQMADADEEIFAGLKNLIVGGDVLSPAHIDKVRKKSPGLNIINGYGPTENTTFSTTYLIDREYKERIPIGRPIANSTAYIVDKNGSLQSIGIAGELWVGGAGVSRGYLNNPELTAEKFVVYPFPHQADFLFSRFPLYRTGDLARWLPDGNIEFLGRIDHQVKIRGFRVELEEIENHILKYPGVKEAVVLIREEERGDKYLCAYSVSDREYELGEMREFLMKGLPDYMIPSYFVQLEKVPLTPNGKVDRRALPKPEVEAEQDYVAPGNEIESALVGLWASVLNIQPGVISIDKSFFELGGHSLKAAILASKIHKELNVKLPLTELFSTPTVRGLAEFIGKAMADIHESIMSVEKKDFYVLSFAQKRMYLLQQMDLGSTAYNMPEIIPLTAGGVDIDRLEESFKKLIKRHESLRTSFHMISDQPVQRVHDDVEFKIENYNTAVKNVKSREEGNSYPAWSSFIRPFDLSHTPLLRVGTLEAGESRDFLFVDMHHIISDGISMQVLREDFMAFVDRKELPLLRVQYKDFSEWQNGENEKEILKRQEEYWLKEFEDEITVLELPTDYPRPITQSFEGEFIDFGISAEETRRLNEFAFAGGFTLFMILAAAFNILLSKLSGQQDIIIGTPVAGRRHADLENIIGMFVNTLALRNYPASEKTFIGFLSELKKRTLEAFENQDYQFEYLVEKVSIYRDIGRNPLFDVMLVLQNFFSPSAGRNKNEDPTGLPVDIHEDYEDIGRTAKFDLTLFAFEKTGKLGFSFQYCTKLFRRESIERFIVYFRKILSTVIDQPDTELSQIKIISEEEKRRILFHFNDTSSDYPRERTIHQLFEWQVEKAPDHIAIHGSSVSAKQEPRPDEMTRHITYRELNHLSNRLRDHLKEKGVFPGSIVGIMANRSLEVIIGILGILKAGGAYLPLEPDFPEDRKNYMLADSGAKVLLTAPELLACIGNDNGETFLHSDAGIDAAANLSFSSPRDLAYIIYTSGSTGRPKGVMAEHRNVIRLVINNNYVEFSALGRVLQTGALSFDASTFEIWGPLLNGAELVLLPKERLLDPEKLKSDINIFQISTMWMTAPLFNQMMDADEDIFTRLQNLLVGGDVLSPFHINRLLGKAPELNIVNGYGPTENTTFSTTLSIREEYRQNIPIGQPIANSSAYIVDTYNRLQPVGVVGELLVGGDGVSRGYLNNPELTADKFGYFDMSYGILYRTGDLARWLSDGTVEFLGRTDHQVKIRGFRIELGEIESQLKGYAVVREAVVVSREDSKGDKYLCAYIVSEGEFEIGGIREYLSGVLPDYMIPSYFVRLDRIPLNPNGKIALKELPEPELDGAEEYAGPVDEIESRLVKVWSEVLGLGEASIGINRSFFELGGHSLKATVLVTKIHKEFNVKVLLADIFRLPRIRELGAYIRGMVKEAHESIVPVEAKEYYALSAPQKRLYILQQMVLDNTSYNMPYAIPLDGSIDKEKLELAFKGLIARHESLRTSFISINGEAVQRIEREVEFSIRSYEIDGESELSGLISGLIRPFDLSQPPLLRVNVVVIGGGRRLLFVDMHHIITDGISQDILSREVGAIYRGEELPVLRLQYKDFSEWQSSDSEDGRIREQESYWLKVFGGDIPVLDLPVDYARPVVQSFEGELYDFDIFVDELKALRAIGLDEGSTLFMILLAIFNVLLSRLSGGEDMIVGTPVAGRRHTDLENIIGMFVNTIALRNHPSGELTFREFLRQVKGSCLEAFENQEYPFENLVEKVSVVRDTGRNPLFDVMFVVQNFGGGAGEGNREEEGNGTVESGDGGDRIPQTSKFDMTLTAVEGGIGEGLHFSIQYCKRLFKRETVERFSRYFIQIVSSVIGDVDRRLRDIGVLSETEKRQLLIDFNEAGGEYEAAKTLHGLFSEQVEKSRGETAVVGEKEGYPIEVTYGELEMLSDRLACTLQRQGVVVGERVGLLVSRSLEMIVGILGILKAGGAYVPLDPKAPGSRIDYILSECGVKVLLTVGSVSVGKEAVIFEKRNCLYIDEVLRHGGSEVNEGLAGASVTDPAYVIFTSGSTGKPKGVPITHRNLSPLLHWGYKQLGLGSKDRVIQNLSYYFDWSVWEIFITLTTGAGLYMVDENVLLDPEACISFIDSHRITVLHVTPTQYRYLVNVGRVLHTLNYLFIGAEKLSRDLARESFESVVMGCRVFNMYGPTESAILAAVLELDRSVDERYGSLSSVPIGRPVGNTGLFVLDRYMNLCPVHVVGELYIGGDGTAAGYLNNPELTAEKFGYFDMSYGILYRTGDLARWLSDGTVEFLGRTDHQVKIRGFRIELGEIESQLKGYEGVREAVVVSREDSKGDKYLCAYIVSEGEFEIGGIRDYLSGVLPDYMIPSYFVRLDRIPLNPNGKIALKELPEPELEGVEEYAGPVDEIEIRLVKVWSEVLGLGEASIGINRSFFELGGHSLKATVLVSRIHKEFNISIPLTEIFTAPTVEALARYLRTVEEEFVVPPDERLVKLKVGAVNSGNLFVIHDGTGEVEGYLEFCKHIRAELNIWGFRIQRHGSAAPYDISIGELARTYIASMKLVQPNGPYYIAGWSLGGTVAFEMAVQLEQSNEEIACLVLFDSPPPDVRALEIAEEFGFESELNFIKKYDIGGEITEKLKNLSDIGPDQFWSFVVNYLESTHFDVELLKRLIVEHGMLALPDFDRLGIKDSIYYLNVGRTLRSARARYIPICRTGANIHYFKASRSKDIEQERWEEYCSGSIDYYTIDGDHYSIFKMPDVSELSEQFDKILYSENKVAKIINAKFKEEISE